MDAFDRLLHQATTNGVLPGTCAIAADKNGRILHAVSSGSYVNSPIWQSKLPSEGVSVQTKPLAEEPQVTKPFTPDTVCWMASMTKLLTTICALKCVEQGTLGLDDDVAEGLLPEFKDVQVLEAMEDDGQGGEKPVFRPAKGKITLRNLLTHSSGLSYEFMHPRLMSWRLWHNQDQRSRGVKKSPADRSEVSRAYLTPLVADPDAGWSYSYGIDWAGCLVERASNTSLEAYMRAHIFAPLGMRDTTFEPARHPHLVARMAGMNERDGDDRLVPQQQTSTSNPLTGAVRHSGGGGLAGTARDYIKVLVAVLRDGSTDDDDSSGSGSRLLRRATVASMFTPQLRDPAHLQRMHANPAAFGLAGNIPPGTRVDFGLGGILNLEPLPTGRPAGALQWGGYPNLFWWANPRDGICGCYFSQLVPPGDVESFEMYKRFETAVNDAFRRDSGKL